MRNAGMKLHWVKDPKSPNRYTSESVRYRFVMIAPPRGKVQLWVQHSDDDWATKPIDQRPCTNKRAAERIAQRFEDSKYGRRLR